MKQKDVLTKNNDFFMFVLRLKYCIFTGYLKYFPKNLKSSQLQGIMNIENRQ